MGDGGGAGGGVGTLMVIVVVEEGKTYLGQVSLGTFAGGGMVLCDPPLSVFPSPYFHPSKQCNSGVCAEMLSIREEVLGRLSLVIVLELLKGVGVISRK